MFVELMNWFFAVFACIVQKLDDKTGPFLHILYSFSWAIRQYIHVNCALQANSCAGMSIKSHVTKATRTPSSLT